MTGGGGHVSNSRTVFPVNGLGISLPPRSESLSPPHLLRGRPETIRHVSTAGSQTATVTPSRTHAEATKRRSIQRLSIDTTPSLLQRRRPVVEVKPDSITVELREFTSRSASPHANVGLDWRAQQKYEDDLRAELDWEICDENPANWSSHHKWLHFGVPCYITFTCSFASTPVLPVNDSFIHDYDDAGINAILPFSLYLLGMVFGPALSTLASQRWGRKAVYIGSTTLFAVFILASALVRSIASLAICRFLAGLCGSIGVHTGWATLGDLWRPGDRTVPTMTLITMLSLGPPLGQVVGGYVVWKDDWEWSQYCILFALAGCAVPVLALRETYRPIVLRKTRAEAAGWLFPLDTVHDAFVAPMELLAEEPVVLIACLCMGFNFGVSCALYPAFEEVFSDVYSFELGMQGLSFISMVVGVVLGAVALVLFNQLIHGPLVARHKETSVTEDGLTIGNMEKWPGMLGTTSPPRRRTSSHSTILRRQSDFGQPDPHRRSNSLASFNDNNFSSFPSRNGSQVSLLSERSVALAHSAAEYLNNIPANTTRRIMPERISTLLHHRLGFHHLCVTLEAHKLKVNSRELAHVLMEAFHRGHHRGRHGSTSSDLADNHAPPTFANPFASRKPPSHPPILAPPEWRLWPALPASILLPTSLFLLGWTATEGIHWIVPLLGMCTFAFAALVVFVSLTLFAIETHGHSRSMDALAGTSVLLSIFGFCLPLIALPMFDKLGTGLATSVFAILACASALVPSVLYYTRVRKRRQREQENVEISTT